eukprot:1284848-Amphidinium_carterae.1
MACSLLCSYTSTEMNVADSSAVGRKKGRDNQGFALPLATKCVDWESTTCQKLICRPRPIGQLEMCLRRLCRTHG